MLGEETVLLKALEGKRGQPEQRPPYPAERGLFGRPTVVQNVQTLALVAWILRQGAPAFRAIGTAEAPGTILVQVRRPAAARASPRSRSGRHSGRSSPWPARSPIRAGRSRRSSSAVPRAGSCRPTRSTRRTTSTSCARPAPTSARARSWHGGRGRIVLDLAQLLTRFCADEACGKTIPCRIGTRRLEEIGDRIDAGRPRPTDPELLADLSPDIVDSALCDHERLATLPFTSGMRYFRAELDDHISQLLPSRRLPPEVAVAAGDGAMRPAHDDRPDRAPRPQPPPRHCPSAC